ETDTAGDAVAMRAEQPDSAHRGDAPLRAARWRFWRAPALIVAIVAGASAAWLAVQRSGVLTGTAEAHDAGWWPASAALVALVGGTTCYGLAALVMLAAGWRTAIRPGWRTDAACAAVALGPLLLGLYLAVIGI